MFKAHVYSINLMITTPKRAKMRERDVSLAKMKKQNKTKQIKNQLTFGYGVTAMNIDEAVMPWLVKLSTMKRTPCL